MNVLTALVVVVVVVVVVVGANWDSERDEPWDSGSSSTGSGRLKCKMVEKRLTSIEVLILSCSICGSQVCYYLIKLCD